MSIDRKNKELQMEKLLKPSLITLEKRGKALFPTAVLVDGLAQIRDTDWAHTDPIKSLEKMVKIPHERLFNDTLAQSRIVEASLIPFTAPFLELCLEVAKYCDIKERVLLDNEGTKILDFTMEGIESAFAWSNEGIIFSMKESVKFYNSLTKPGNLIRDWLVDECKDYKDKALSQSKRIDFYPTVSTIISMLCRITGQENDQRFRKEFVGFIYQISRGKGIRWSKVISNCLAQQLSMLVETKRFYMSSYLVFLLLHGKNRKSTIADTKYLFDLEIPVWRSYPRFMLENRWDEFKMMNEGFECRIYAEIKGTANMTRISEAAIQVLQGHADFYLEETDATYIRVYGSIEPPYRLPRYASDRFILMEFCRHLSYLHEKVWCKKGATTSQLPIRIGKYECMSWRQVKTMKMELAYYGFTVEHAVENYDPEGVIGAFYKNTWQTDYPHKSLGKLERYRNIDDIEQISQINKDLAAEEKLSQTMTKKKKRRGLQEENAVAKIHPSIILKKNPPIPCEPPPISPSVRLTQGQSGQYATFIVQSGQTIDQTIQGLSQEIRSTSHPYKHLKMLVEVPLGGPSRDGQLYYSGPSSPASPPSNDSEDEYEIDEGDLLREPLEDGQTSEIPYISGNESNSSVEETPAISTPTMEEPIQATRPTSTRASTPRQPRKTPPPQRKPPPLASRRTLASKGIVSSSGGDGGNEEDEGENHDQRKKRREDKHQGNPERQVTIVANLEPSYNFNMATLLKNLRAYHPSEVRADLETD